MSKSIVDIEYKRRKGGSSSKISAERYLRDDIHCGFDSCSSFDGLSLAPLSLLSKRFTLFLDETCLDLYAEILREPLLQDSCQFVICFSELSSLRSKKPKRLKTVEDLLKDPKISCFVFYDIFHPGVNELMQVREESSIANPFLHFSFVWYLENYSTLVAPSHEFVLILSDLASDHPNRNIMSLAKFLNSNFVDLAGMIESVMPQDSSSDFLPFLSMQKLSAYLSDPKQDLFFKGKLHVSRGYRRGYVQVQDFRVRLDGSAALNRGLHEDIVAVQITKTEIVDDVLQRSGQIVYIFERSRKYVCGSIDCNDAIVAKGSGSTFLLPFDSRFPKVRFYSSNLSVLSTSRLCVAIDRWDCERNHPDGHLLKILGPAGDKVVETELLLLEHEVRHSQWSQAVLECLPPKDWKPHRRDSFRVDLTHLNVFSIDPPGCTDIDDALHVRTLEDGNLEIGVHIADVTHFVRPGSALDEEAALRATSVYLVDQRIDMIPSLLSTDICSLHANVERFTMSVIWTMSNDSNFNIIDTRFEKTIIKSRAAMAYADAQKLLDSQEECDRSPYGDAVRKLNAVAKHLRAKRLDDGALTLASPEVKFLLDSSQTPTDMEMYELKEANALIEEFMLLANIAVAKHIYAVYPGFSLLRRHPIPAKSNFDRLLKVAKSKDIYIDVSSSKKLSESLDKVRPYDLQQLLRIIATRCMFQAVYFCSGEITEKDFHHYGLAAPMYTHFTSPIRRYADVIVHRLLAASIKVDDLSSDFVDAKWINSVCDNLNHRTRMAQLAGRSSVELYKVLYFKENQNTECEAVLTAIESSGIDVFIPRFGIDGNIAVEDLEEHSWKICEDEKFVSANNRKLCVLSTFSVFISTKETAGGKMYLHISMQKMVF